MTGPVTLYPMAPSSVGPAHTVAVIAPTFTTPGLHVITAKYNGDTNYAAAATSPSTTISVVYGTSISFGISPTNINYGQSVTLTAVIASQGKSPAMTGQVQFGGGGTFSNVTNTPGTDSNGNQMLTATATTVPTSSGVFWAIYQGDTNYALASSNNVYVNVNIPDFTLGPQSGVSVVPAAGQSGSATITITPMSQTPSTVVLQLNYSSGIAGYTIGLSSTQVNLNGAPVTAMLTLTPTGSGPAHAARAKVHKAGVFSVGPGEWWRLGISVGLAIFFLAGIPGRRRRVRIIFGMSAACLLYFALGCGGGGGGGGGGGRTMPTPTSVTLTTSNASVPQSGNATITAAVTGSSLLPGTVSFFDYGSQVAGPFPLSNGVVEIGSNYLSSIGVHQVTAKYSGDQNNLASTSSVLVQTITGTFPATIQGATGADTHTLQVTVGIQ